jgi:hypothetical protein
VTAQAKRERIRRQDLTERRCSRSQFDEAEPEDQQQGLWSHKKLLAMDLKFCLAVLRSGETRARRGRQLDSAIGGLTEVAPRSDDGPARDLRRAIGAV